MLKTEMSFERVEGIYIGSYLKTLTQQEIDGMIAFYKSETGKVALEKMPLISQDSMEAIQRRVQTWFQWLAQTQDMLKTLMRRQPSTE
jgi:uncharacterized protein